MEDIKAFGANRYTVSHNPTSEYIYYIQCKNCIAIFNNLQHPHCTKLHLNVLSKPVHKTVTCRQWRYQRLHIYNYDVDLLMMSRI